MRPKERVRQQKLVAVDYGRFRPRVTSLADRVIDSGLTIDDDVLTFSIKVKGDDDAEIVVKAGGPRGSCM